MQNYRQVTDSSSKLIEQNKNELGKKRTNLNEPIGWQKVHSNT